MLNNQSEICVKNEKRFELSSMKFFEENYYKVSQLVEEEFRNGTENIVKDYKNNKMYKINKLLYNPYLLPRERLCKEYYCTNTYIKGKLQNNDIIEVKCKKLDGKDRYLIKINGKAKKIITGSQKCVNNIKKLLGLDLRLWDDESGSKIRLM